MSQVRSPGATNFHAASHLVKFWVHCIRVTFKPIAGKSSRQNVDMNMWDALPSSLAVLQTCQELNSKQSWMEYVAHLARHGERVRAKCFLQDAADALNRFEELGHFVGLQVCKAGHDARRNDQHVSLHDWLQIDQGD